jgi:hypothetical protein
MEGADLSEVRLEGASLRVTCLTYVDCVGAQLLETDLEDAQLSGANLAFSRIQASNLTGAKLRLASLWCVDIDRHSKFGKADFFGAATRAAPGLSMVFPSQLLHGQIGSMFGDGSVTLPGIEPGGEGWPAHWPVRALDAGEFDTEWRRWQADPEGYVPPP